MTHDQTTPAPVEVTQADREAAEAFWQEYGPFRMGTVSALSAAFARHRIAHPAPPADLVELVDALDICPVCSGAGGDNNVWTCGTCGGSGGVPSSVNLVKAVGELLAAQDCIDNWSTEGDPAWFKALDRRQAAFVALATQFAKHTRTQGEG